MYSKAPTGTVLIVNGRCVAVGGECGLVTLGSRISSNVVGDGASAEDFSITLGSRVSLFSVRNGVVAVVSLLSMEWSG